MLKRNLLITVGALGVILTAPYAVYADAVSASDFVKKFTVANEFEIETSALAADKSQNKEVKAFAEQMIADHRAAAAKLDTVLKTAKLEPAPAPNLDAPHQSKLETLQTASNDTFDDKYIAIQTDAHMEAVDLFSQYSKNGNDPTLKDFATQTLPTLQEHLTHIEQIKENK